MQAKRLSGGRWIAQRNAPAPTLVLSQANKGLREKVMNRLGGENVETE